MKDYSNWKPFLDYENDSPWVIPNRPWLKHRFAAKTPKVPKTIKIDPIPLHKFVKLRIKDHLDKVCVEFKEDEVTYTYRELQNYSDRIANALWELGIKKGDSVGIFTPNNPEFIFCSLGILETGASVSPINKLLKETDVSHIIREAGNINTIFVHIGLLKEIKKTIKEGAKLDNIILLGTKEGKEGYPSFDEFIENKAPKPPDVDIDPENDLAAMLFTGGTTGLPKGVMLTHNNLVMNILQGLYNGGEAFEPLIYGKLTVLQILPLCHAMGFAGFIRSLCLAIHMVMLRFEPSKVLEAIESYKIRFFGAVPAMYQMLVNCPDFTKRDISSLLGASSGSAALSPEINKKWEQVTGLKVGQGYGLTETSPFTHGNAAWMPKVKRRSIGAPAIDTDSIIVNTVTLEEEKIGEVGEIWIRGPQIMKGYWKRPEATSNVLVKRKDGNVWLRTGDLGRIDEDGFFYIEGRSKDMIKYKGYKILPVEVEYKLVEHSAILEAGVVAAPDPNIGETIKAFVVLKEEYRGNDISERDIIEWCKERMAGYKYPRIVEFIDELPRTPVRKIDRKKLREMELKTQIH